MKELKKMSFASIQSLLSKEEMKQIMAGSGGFGCPSYGCGAGNNGTCITKVVDGSIRCACSDDRGGICYF